MKDVYIGIVYEEPEENYVNVKVFSNHFNGENPPLKVYKKPDVKISLHDEISFEKGIDNKYYLLSTNINEVYCKVLFVQYSTDFNDVMFILEKDYKRFKISLNNISEDLKLVIPGDNLYLSYDGDEIIRIEVKYHRKYL